jgi:hypothetical protein
MKTSLICALVSSLIIRNGIAQDASVHLTSDENIPDRLTLIESAITLPDAQENIFWNLYRQYEEQRIKEEDWSFTQLVVVPNGDNAASLNPTNDDPSSSVMEILKIESGGVKLKKEYFNKIESALNGSVALQFLQSEALFDLIQRSVMYEKMGSTRPEWSDGMMKDENVKCRTMESILGLYGTDAQKFRPLFEDYQFDYDRIVGHQYFFFEQYIEDVTDLTPNQCKKLGTEFLNMQQKEVIIRKNYFQKMREFFGVDVAMRFLALDDYFSLMDKLKTWSDATLYASK